MPQKALDTSVPQVLLTGLAMGESPRWHDGRLWLSDWGAQEILAVDSEGRREVILRVPFLLPFCFDWLPDGSLVVVSGREGRVLRRDPAGSLTTYADLTSLSRNAWNEIVVDGRGNAYVNTADAIALVTPGGSARQVADGGAFPNGMAVTPDNSTLIMAESHGRKLTAFEIATDGSLSNRRVWADLGDGVPDGICLDAEKAMWYADVPEQAVRARPGGRRGTADDRPGSWLLFVRAWRCQSENVVRDRDRMARNGEGGRSRTCANRPGPVNRGSNTRRLTGWSGSPLLYAPHVQLGAVPLGADGAGRLDSEIERGDRRGHREDHVDRHAREFHGIGDGSIQCE